MRRSILVVAVMITAILVASSAAAYAKQSDTTPPSTTSPSTTSPSTTSPDTTGPITSQNHAWATYHWARQTNPLTLKLGDNVSSAWDSYLNTASSDWSQTSVLNTTVGTGDVSSRDMKRKKCTPTAGKVEVCNATYGSTGWSGLAQIWIDTGGSHITAGTAKMNDTYIKPDDGYKKSHVMCQEVGHNFGLGHQDTTGASLGTCMDYSNTASTEGQHPNAHDYEELRAIYDPTFTSTSTATKSGHLDTTTTTSSQLPAAAKRGNYNTKAEWGKLKARDSLGKHEVYERDFSDGKLITFVEVEDQAAQPPQKK